MSRGTSTALIASGASLAVLSIVLCVVGEGKYATAVEVYNEHIAGPGGAEEQDEPSESDGSDTSAEPEPKSSDKAYEPP